jgi:hypothetical protein
LAACSGADAVRPEPVRGIKIVAGSNVTDSVSAVLTQALVVEVHDSTGALAPVGTVVLFVPGSRRSINGADVLLQSLIPTGGFNTFASSTTDAAGRAVVRVQLGELAGEGRLAISVPIFGISDTARYTITPGAAARVVVSPVDTMLYAGKSFAYRGGVTDQFGNALTGHVTWNTSSTGLAVVDGGVVTAATTGRYTVVASAGALTATLAVSVVPVGRLAGTQFGLLNGAPFPAVSIIDLDGSHNKVLAWGGNGTNPKWMPDRSAIIYASLVDGSLWQLCLVDTNGVTRPFFANGIPFVTHQTEPNPSRNGQWLFFSAYDSRCTGGNGYCLYRSRIDGSQPELLGIAATVGSALRPAPSPDGSRVAFMRGGQLYFSNSAIQVLDVATKTVSTWSVAGSNPSWSPDGTQVAFVSDTHLLSIIRADGTALHALNTGGRTYQDYPVSWSPDGKYVMARSTFAYHDLIDVKTGATIPLLYGPINAEFFNLLNMAP